MYINKKKKKMISIKQKKFCVHIQLYIYIYNSLSKKKGTLNIFSKNIYVREQNFTYQL